MRPSVAVFRALADETRLQMMALIQKHAELCVCDLENVLGITQSKASRHLRYLLNAGLLQDRRAAIWIYYRVAENLSAEQKAILAVVPNMLDRRTMSALDNKLSVWLKEKNCGLRRGVPVTETTGEDVIP